MSRQDVQTISSPSLLFQISPAAKSHKTFQTLSAKFLGLNDRSYPAAILTKYKHLKDLPLQSLEHFHPLLVLIKAML